MTGGLYPLWFWDDYDFGTIELMLFRVSMNAGDIRLVDHSQIAWITPGQLSAYTFTPADRPVVEKILRGDILI